MSAKRPSDAMLADARRALPLRFKFDPELPITARRGELLELLGPGRGAAVPTPAVIIVAGDTGSGKSTQLPQYCLEAGRGIQGRIAHTQPRRLAARALAARIAQELSEEVGGTVGYRVRFADRVADKTRLVLMTDGLLLAELNADPLLQAYDTVIVDEAHERSLNVDLLLGVLKRLLVRRPELKVIITSATLDVERMARFFDDAPVLSVSGRSHPIEVRYAVPPTDADETDLPAAVLQAYREIESEPGPIGGGDVLVFLPGEREIRDVGELLERELAPGAEVIPLYARLDWDQQSRIFQRGTRRRVVLATNVAETSITVPGIRAVIDSGLARVSRYSARNRLQRLPIEPIARASADQRKGRCGRLGPGLCLRLYTEEDFAGRPAFTEPEVLRTNLAALLLRLAADGLGAAEEFPFLDPPDARALNDGYRLLQELGARAADRRITRQGRAMARLPLDPRLARALLESQRFHAEGELLAIVSGLSVPDARMTVAGAEAEAEDSAESAALAETRSEFSALERLWRAYSQARRGPRRELRRWCKERRLSLLRLSEWDNVHGQVKDRAAEMGIRAGPRAASYTAIHRSLLAGFCTMVGVRTDEGSYLGTRGVRFHIFPGSPLRRRKPRWVMAANIVETSRVYARRVADIQPVWIEAAAAHLLQREYLAPDWNESRGEVVAQERVSLLGLTLSAARRVNYGPIAPEESRHIFAREALVYRRLGQRPDWLLANDAAVAAAQRVEERLRTRDLLATPESLVEFYDRALPRQVSSAATVEVFSRRLSAEAKQALRFSPADVFARTPDPAALARFPQTARIDGLDVPIDYRFEPGAVDDGATLRVPLLALALVTRSAIDAAIPGFALPRVEALLRSLPKDARRLLIPIGATAARYLTAAAQADAAQAAPDLPPLATWLTAACAVPAALVRFDPRAVPAHLTAALAVIDEGREIARGADLGDLRRATAERAEAALERAARGLYPGDWRRFAMDELPARQPLSLAEGAVVVFPALARVGDRVEVRLSWSAAEAQRQGIEGTAYLARLCLERQARDLARRLAGDSGLLLAAGADIRSGALTDALLQRTFHRACLEEAAPPRTRHDFERALERGRGRLFDCLAGLSAEAATWFAGARAVRRLLADPRARGLAALAAESEAHLRRLLSTAVLAGAPWSVHLARYLKAEERRWQRLLARGNEPPQIALELEHWTRRHASLEKALQAERRWLPQFEDLGAWVEEYRVSLYAQELKTVGPVSAARLSRRAAEIEAWLSR